VLFRSGSVKANSASGKIVLWWSPDPRMVLDPKDIKISRSLAKTLRKQEFRITFDQNFRAVITACSESRLEKGKVQDETWILDEMIEAYVQLHEAGFAHSVECWKDNQLVGGLYGIAIGKIFFGESMFSRVSDASKIAFVSLAQQLEQWGFKLIDCQVYTSHLESLGASMITRKQFLTLLKLHAVSGTKNSKWQIKND